VARRDERSLRRWAAVRSLHSHETIHRSRSCAIRGSKMLFVYSAVVLAVIAVNVVIILLAAAVGYRRMHHD
jgi:hypothetical protein